MHCQRQQEPAHEQEDHVVAVGGSHVVELDVITEDWEHDQRDQGGRGQRKRLGHPPRAHEYGGGCGEAGALGHVAGHQEVHEKRQDQTGNQAEPLNAVCLLVLGRCLLTGGLEVDLCSAAWVWIKIFEVRAGHRWVTHEGSPRHCDGIYVETSLGSS